MPHRILVLTPRFPFPLYGGDVLRIYRLCEALPHHFQLTLLSICQTRAEMETPLPEGSPFSEVHRIYLPKWRSYINTLLALVTGQSMQTAYYESREFARAVSRLQGTHDLLLCHLARTAPYAKDFKGPKALELTDFIPLTYARSNKLKGKNLSMRRLIYTLEQRRVEKAQNELARDFDLVTFVSEVDRAMFLASSGMPEGKVVTFSNGVDLQERPFSEVRAGKTLVFIGTLKAMPNADAVSHFIVDVLPAIRRHDPEVKLRVIGAVDEKFKARFESPHVQFTGPVPDLARAAEDCVIGICPVRIGAGMQNKMLDYMALGLPAVTSRVGAEGLDGSDGSTFVVASTPEEFADTILSLLQDEGRRRELAQSARMMIEANSSWSARLAGLPGRLLDILP